MFYPDTPPKSPRHPKIYEPLTRPEALKILQKTEGLICTSILLDWDDLRLSIDELNDFAQARIVADAFPLGYQDGISYEIRYGQTVRTQEIWIDVSADVDLEYWKDKD